MKYFTIEIVTNAAGTAKAIFERDTIDIAKKEFHHTLNYNINLAGVEMVSVAIVDEHLSILKSETWRAPAEPTE